MTVCNVWKDFGLRESVIGMNQEAIYQQDDWPEGLSLSEFSHNDKVDLKLSLVIFLNWGRHPERHGTNAEHKIETAGELGWSV